MSQDNPSPSEHPQKLAPLDPAQQSKQSIRALGSLLERVAPWLVAFGSWIFGGLIAFNLIFLSAILNTRPVDVAVLISITAFACALPLNVTGLFLLKLFKDLQDIGIDDLTLQAFQDAGFPDIEAYIPPVRERPSQNRKRSHLSLGYSFGIGAFTFALTLIGLAAALWHVAWWTGLVFASTTVICAILVAVAIGHSLPPESEAEKVLKSRYLEYRIQQGKK